MNKTYSKFDELPKGQAAGSCIPGCLVLEGGAFRGLYTQGALDVLLENRIRIGCVIGVSAGALSGLNYASGQIGRSARANLGYRHDSRYVGTKAFREGHSPLNLDFLFNEFNEMDPMNEEEFFREEQRYVAVAANCETGQAEYFEKGQCDIFSAMKASASMPYISPMVEVDGKKCLDGGCCVKIPFQWALDQGYEKIVVIKTRERGYHKKIHMRDTARRIYGSYPEFARSLDYSALHYNREVDEIQRLEDEGRIFVLAPSQKVTVNRVESDVEKLGALYELGRRDMLENLPGLREYLGPEI